MKDKASTKYALLGALMRGPMHGYEILQFLETGLGPALHISTSQLYVLLQRLEKDGLVRSSLEIQDTRPTKRVFSLRPAGKEVFLEWLQSPTEHVRDLRIEFLSKLFFINCLSLKGGDELVDAQTKVLELARQRILKRQKREKNSYNRLVYGFKIATLKGWLQWLKREAKPFADEDNNHE